MSVFTVEKLAKAVGKATRSTKFCVDGFLPDIDAGIDIVGIGLIKLPLKRTVAKEIISLCQSAPYGRGRGR